MPLLATVAMLLGVEHVAPAGIVPITFKTGKKMRQRRGIATLHGA